jgi:hypothetical protein
MNFMAHVSNKEVNEFSRATQISQMGRLWLLLSSLLWLLFELNTLLLFPRFPFTQIGFSETYVPGVGDSNLVLNRLLQGQQDISFWHPIYTSQFGLHGVVLSAIDRVTPLESTTFAIYSAHIFSLLTALVLGLFAVSIYRQYGAKTTFVFLVLTGFSPWLSGFSFSLFWFISISILPFVTCWILYPLVRNHFRRKLFLYGLVVILVCLKSLCGYEYITAVILSCTVPIVYDYSQRGDFKLKSIFFEIFWILVAGVTGFILALILHLLQLEFIFGSSFEIIGNRIVERTTLQVGPDHQQFIENFQRNLNGRLSWLSPTLLLGISSFFRYFGMSAIKIPPGLSPETGLISVSIGSCTLFLFFSSFILLSIRNSSVITLRPLMLAGMYSFLAPISWQILAFNHMSIHLHLNAIVFYIPFLLLCYVFIGALISELINLIGNWFSPLIKSFLKTATWALLLTVVITAVFKEIVVQQSLSTFLQPSSKSYEQLRQLYENQPGIMGYVDHISISEIDDTFSIAGIEGSIVANDFTPKRVLEIMGWSVDLETPDAPLNIIVQMNGMMVSQDTTSLPRPDVEAALDIEAPQTGFNIKIPIADSHQLELNRRILQVYAVNPQNPLTLTEIPLP